MGPHAFFILGSYGITALVVAALVLRSVLDHRAQVRALNELEARGMRRRSSARAATGEPMAAGQATP